MTVSFNPAQLAGYKRKGGGRGGRKNVNRTNNIEKDISSNDIDVGGGIGDTTLQPVYGG